MSFKVDDKRIAHQMVDGEVIAIDFANGAYFSMRSSAAEIWQMLVDGAEPEAVVSVYSGRGIEVAEDIRTFLADLVQAGLLETAPPSMSAPIMAPAGAYERPVLEKFDDMADLIMMDPVHDVSEIGWPHAPPAA